jgi:hypothetical protein
VRGDVSIDSETFLMIEFINLKIKSAQSFGCDYKDGVCLGVFIGGECSYIYIYIDISICVYIVFLKNIVHNPT